MRLRMPAERYSQVPNLDVPQRVAMRESFLFTLDDLHDTIAIHPTSAEEVVLMR